MVTSFAGEVSRGLAEGRELAESLMLDTCTVSPVTGVDESTGAPALGAAVYTGRCKVQASGTQEANPEAGGATYTVQRGAVHFPVGSFTPHVDQVVTLTAVVLDPLLVGRVFRVVALLHKSMATAYRLGVEEVV